MTTAAAIAARLRAQHDPQNVAGQQRFGITPRSEQLGLPLPLLRRIARDHRRDHTLALALWKTAVHDARLVAAFADDPKQVTRGQMEAWARDFDSWALVDAVCVGLFNRTPFSEEKAFAWSGRRAEFVKRAGFVLMAGMAVHRKELPDETFLAFLPIIHREATDERHYVRKGVNWALRQIGKRNAHLRRAAIAQARHIHSIDSPAARWIAADALRELQRI
ncbi:MAG: DNA alkylation repair protein [Opitutaceae bacterium]|nr:DNA alkylation repair protein [Opitutaceae bacterium]